MNGGCLFEMHPAASNRRPALSNPRFKSASAFQDDVLALPVKSRDDAAAWYAKHFGMTELERRDEPVRTVILQRDGARIGFAENGRDSTQDGAAILVSNIHALKVEFESVGLAVGNWRIDNRDGKQFQVFFIVAPDGLCFYFHEPV